MSTPFQNDGTADKRPIEWANGQIHWITQAEFNAVKESGMFGEFYPYQPERWEDLPASVPPTREGATPIKSWSPESDRNLANVLKGATAETDAAQYLTSAKNGQLKYAVSADFARKLERDCDRLAALVEGSKAALRLKEVERQYHMDAINTLAVKVDCLGETSEQVVDRAISRIAALRTSLATAEREIARLKHEREKLGRI